MVADFLYVISNNDHGSSTDSNSSRSSTPTSNRSGSATARRRAANTCQLHDVSLRLEAILILTIAL